MRRGLPDVPERVVGSPSKHFEAAVGVDRCRRVAGDDAAERAPRRPRAGVRGGLPDVPEGVVGSADKDLEAAVGVAATAGRW